MIYTVTGCLGFIGSHFVDSLGAWESYVIGIDKETYAANKDVFPTHNRAAYIKDDIATMTSLPDCDVIVNFAAETHVDNSIIDASPFTHSNVLGVQNILDLLRKMRPGARPRLIHISTDEVYGDYAIRPNEQAVLAPSNPYAASKAAADMYIAAYARTYGIEYNIIRPSNCWGTRQYKEKLIPKTINHFRLGRVMPIHGDGTQTRSWLHVSDAAAAIHRVISYGTGNTIYNIGGVSVSINDMVDSISTAMYRFNAQTRYGSVRPGMDISYSVDDSALRALGWSPRFNTIKELRNGLDKVVEYEQKQPIRLLP